MDKALLRKSVMSQLRDFTEQQHRERSTAIGVKLLQDPAFQAAKTVGLTLSRFPEVDTTPLIEHCWRIGKQVAVPKCDPAKRTMTFRLIDSLEQLETVYMDLREPLVAKTPLVEADQIDLLIVPGVAFAESGYRIGFGGGYYDRYLADYHGVALSLAFEVQVVADVPIESHDVPVDGIITEQRTIDAKAVRR